MTVSVLPVLVGGTPGGVYGAGWGRWRTMSGVDLVGAALTLALPLLVANAASFAGRSGGSVQRRLGRIGVRASPTNTVFAVAALFMPATGPPALAHPPPRPTRG